MVHATQWELSDAESKEATARLDALVAAFNSSSLQLVEPREADDR